MKNAKPQPKQASKQAKYDMTFVVPVYNTAQYLDECLQRLIEQNVNKEILCINDGSTDNSLAVLQKWAKKHPEIRIISQENKGLSITRNVGIDAAQGRYIWFVDADDYLVVNNLASLIEVADTHQVNIARGLVEWNNQDKIVVYRLSLPTVREKYYSGEIYAELTPCVDFLRASVQVGYTPKIWAGFYRTAFLREHQCYFPNARMNAEDEPFALKVFGIQPESLMFEVSTPMYFYRQHPDSISRDKTAQFQGSLAAFAQMMAWCSELEQQFMDTPPDDKRWNFRKDSLWLSRFIALRLLAASMEIFMEMDEQQQAQSKHLITLEYLHHLDEFCYLMLTSDTGPYYNFSTSAFLLIKQVKAIISAH